MQRANYEDLARELANTRIQKDALEKELMAERLKNNIRVEKQVMLLNNIAKDVIKQCYNLSNVCAQMYQVTEEMLTSSALGVNQNRLTQTLSATPSPTAKVQPTIGGHVISRPVVNLTRLRPERSEANAMGSALYSRESDNHMELATARAPSQSQLRLSVPPENLEDELFQSNTEESASSNYDLTTIPEEDEPEGSSASRNDSENRPLISGVFRDVNVYVCPSSSKRKSKSLNKISRNRRSGTSQSGDGLSIPVEPESSLSTFISPVAETSNTKEILTAASPARLQDSTDSSYLPSNSVGKSIVHQLNKSSQSETKEDSIIPLMLPIADNENPLEGSSNLLDLIHTPPNTSTPKQSGGLITMRKRKSSGSKNIFPKRSTRSRKKSSEDAPADVKTPKRSIRLKKKSARAEPKVTRDKLEETGEEAEQKKSSPIFRRSKRAVVKQVNLKEPSAKKKLRR